MIEKEHFPRIRFKSFSEEWKLCKLKEISEQIIRKNINLESTLPLTISAQYGLVDQTTFFNNQVAGQNISSYYLIRKGEFAYNKSTSQDYPVGAVKRLERYEMGILSTLYILFRLQNTVSSDYLAAYFDSACWHKEITVRAAEGARNHGLLNISADNFFDIEIYKPGDTEEQEKVGYFLQSINQFLLNQQVEYDKILNLKKIMLRKMFPHKNTEVPEIRIEKYSEKWKRRKLGEYLEVSPEKNGQLYFSQKDVLSVSGEFGIVNQIKHKGRSYAGVSVKNYGVVHEGDIVYTKSPLKEEPYGIIKSNQGQAGIVSALYAVYHPKAQICSLFIQYYFELSERLNQYLQPLISKGAKNAMNISNEGVLSGYVIFPCYEEQKKIAEYFEKLDQMIKLRRERLEKLRQIKKILLRKMFI